MGGKPRAKLLPGRFVRIGYDSESKRIDDERRQEGGWQ